MTLPFPQPDEDVTAIATLITKRSPNEGGDENCDSH
jgi:hypothetical protein